MIDRVMPVLSAMGTSVLRTGAVGSGQAMKALNNLVTTGGFLIGIEALLIGQRFGLDPAVMVDVLNAATGMNNSTQKKFKQFVLSRKFDAGFTMGLLAKDLSIALQVGARDRHAGAVVGACARRWCWQRRRCSGRTPIIPRWRSCASGWRGRNWEPADAMVVLVARRRGRGVPRFHPNHRRRRRNFPPSRWSYRKPRRTAGIWVRLCENIPTSITTFAPS